MNHYVYEITNLVNGKKYIGKRSCKCPIEEDKYIGSGTLLKKAIEKYGKENFKKEILQICENEEMAYEWEKVYIEQVKACENSNYYNITAGGDGFTSNDIKKLWGNDIYRINMSLKMKEKWGNKEHREKVSNSMKEKWRNEDYRKKATDKIRYYTRSQQNREIHSDIMLKRWSDKAYRKKITEGMKEIWLNEDYKKKMSMKLKEVLNTEECKTKMSLSMKRRWENEEYRKARIDSITGAKHHSAIKVVCVNTGEVYDYIKQASDSKKVQASKISKCCKGNVEYAGNDGTFFYKWMYYKDYVKLTEEDLSKIKSSIIKYENHLCKKVILMNNKKLFNSIKEAKEYIGLKSDSGISECCKGKRELAGKINGEPAKWMYYEDYLKTIK